MIEQKIRYTEKYPEVIDITFNTREEFNKFYLDRCGKVVDILNPEGKTWNTDKWIKKFFRLNKDGTPRKYNPAEHLHTKKSELKQKEGWKKYQERRKKEKEDKDKLIRENYNNALNILITNNIDVTKLNIKPRFDNF
jgi:hypothetical protein